jgi:two-component system, OmpR family, sensor histidine kinase KdpD
VSGDDPPRHAAHLPRCCPRRRQDLRHVGRGQRRLSRGTDVVVGLVETHGRQNTAAQIDGLAVIPRKAVGYRGARFEEMDLDAVLARRPHVALVDELAHTNIPGSGPNTKRWEDIGVLLDAGIDVISTLNIQHLESMNDLVQQITGAPQRETVPDSVVRAADQIELIDMTPEALRRRMVHGNVYPSERVDAALGNYFRPGNLTALRELALLWLADSVEEGMQRYRREHGITETWETKERIVIGLTGGPEGETLVRRAARISARSVGAKLLAVHIARSDGLTRLSGPIDVHLVSHDFVHRGRTLPALTGGLTVRPRIAGLATGGALLTVLTVICSVWRGSLTLPSAVLLYLLVVVITSVIGGFYPAATIAITGSLLVNFFVLPPLHTFTIADPQNVLALVIFLIVAALVSRVVDIAARRSVLAARARAEAETLSAFAGTLLRGEQEVPALLDRVLETFAMESASLLHRPQDQREWTVVAASGPQPPTRPSAGQASVEMHDDLWLVLSGHPMSAEDQRLLAAFAAHIAAAHRQQKLAAAARAVEPLAEAERQRTALLNAVSHDLRTPIAAAKAAVSSLRAPEVTWGEEDRQELLASAEDSLDRLTDLVTNLLDLSRLRAGALPVLPSVVGLDDVVARALDHAAPQHGLEVDVPADLPPWSPTPDCSSG